MGNRCCFVLSCDGVPDCGSEGEPIPLKAGLGGNDRGEAAEYASSSLLLGFNFPLELGRPPTITALESTSVSAPSRTSSRDAYEFSRLSAAKLASERSRRAAASSGAFCESESLEEEPGLGSALEDRAGGCLEGFGALAFAWRFGVFKIDMAGVGNLLALDGFSELAQKRS